MVSILINPQILIVTFPGNGNINSSRRSEGADQSLRENLSDTKLREIWNSSVDSSNSFVQDNENPTFSIKQLSQELLIPETKLERKAAEGTASLHQYVEKKREKYGTILQSARSDYQKIAENYIPSSKNPFFKMLKAKNSSDILLPEQLLMKIVRKSNLSLSRSQNNGELGEEVKLKNYSTLHILAKRENGNLQIVSWSGAVEIDENHPKYLGRGGFGIVQKVDDIANGCSGAFKFALARDPSYQKKAETDLINEANKLKSIHGNTIKVGLQAPPLAVFKITNRSSNKDNIIGSLQKLYNCGSMIDASIKKNLRYEDMTKKQVLLMIKEIYSGLNELHNDQKTVGTIIHGDIKPDNIFVEQDQEGNFHFSIADLGDAKDVKNELRIENRCSLKNIPLGTVATPAYHTEGDWKTLQQSIDLGNQDSWIAGQKKRDIYAATASIWTAITQKLPYPMPPLAAGTYFPITWEGVENSNILQRVCGKPLADLLESALEDDPKYRPQIEKVLETVDQELNKL